MSKQNKQHSYSSIRKINKKPALESFNKFIINSNENQNELFEIIKKGCVDEIGCRFNIWRLCLRIIGVEEQLNSKVDQIRKLRKHYKEIKANKTDNHIKSPISKDVNVAIPKNPLIKSTSKIDRDIQSDYFLRQEIKKDVERTYQQEQLFQQQFILKLMNKILFVWCKQNPQVSYKQGMHEILAEIIYVYFCEADMVNKIHEQKYQSNNNQNQQNNEVSSKITKQSQQHLNLNQKHNTKHQQKKSYTLIELYTIFNCIDFAQADIYTVFNKIMGIQMYMFQTQFTQNKQLNPKSKNNSPLLQRIIQLEDQKLKKLDLELFRVLKLQGVQTKTFLIRWYKCMFTREFDLTESIIIWDLIYLDYYQSPNCKIKGKFQFLDAMCLAMFIYMRSVVFNRQTSYEMTHIYQKYPSLKGEFLQQLIKLAHQINQQLRNQKPLQSNWYEQSDKAKKVHFLGSDNRNNKDHYTNKIEQFDNINEVIMKEQMDKNRKNSEKFRQKLILNSKKQSKIQKQTKNQKYSKIQKEYQKPQNKELSQLNGIQQLQMKKKKIEFDQNQICQIVDILRKSIALNNTTESKILALEVCHLLQRKL